MLRDGLPDVVPLVLDEQHPYIPLSIDIDGDAGVVLLLMPSWSEGGGQGPSIRLCLLQRHGDDWHCLLPFHGQHGVDKIYGGFARHDRRGVAQVFLDWSFRSRFEPSVVDARIAAWLDQARQATTAAERLLETGDPTGAWISIRRAGTALAEVGHRTLGSAGRVVRTVLDPLRGSRETTR